MILPPNIFSFGGILFLRMNANAVRASSPLISNSTASWLDADLVLRYMILEGLR